ncbi:hypothetical protein CA13_22350 [Planctomycetes bacterium CA13]|uniref:Uncharacterized protein n=1 Tax=Novipirellula herctigrandis TaxID=2527986 RepID=A0A5C5Z0G0_9BACT|nr:hypothetical protein CA13_22350 [Planctomycetes bacterium CA13]
MTGFPRRMFNGTYALPVALFLIESVSSRATDQGEVFGKTPLAVFRSAIYPKISQRREGFENYSEIAGFFS